jgi:hypothetical protein
MGLERGPLSLVSTTEELLGRNSSCCGLENCYRLLVGKPERKRRLGRPRRRLVDNIKMDLLDRGCGDVDWIDVAQDRDKLRALVNAVMNLRVP